VLPLISLSAVFERKRMPRRIARGAVSERIGVYTVTEIEVSDLIVTAAAPVALEVLSQIHTRRIGARPLPSASVITANLAWQRVCSLITDHRILTTTHTGIEIETGTANVTDHGTANGIEIEIGTGIGMTTVPRDRGGMMAPATTTGSGVIATKSGRECIDVGLSTGILLLMSLITATTSQDLPDAVVATTTIRTGETRATRRSDSPTAVGSAAAKLTISYRD
jgi:hypothetical protein